MLAHVLCEGEEASLGIIPSIRVELLVIRIQGLLKEFNKWDNKWECDSWIEMYVNMNDNSENE